MQSNQEKLVAHILDQLDLNPAAIPAETYDTLISDRPQLVDIDDMISYIKRIGTDLDAIDKTVELVEKIEDETSIPDDRGMVAELLQDSDKMVKILKLCFDMATAAGEDGLADFLAGRMDAHRKHSWQLRATLG
jgi:rubrerythrin